MLPIRSSNTIANGTTIMRDRTETLRLLPLFGTSIRSHWRHTILKENQASGNVQQKRPDVITWPPIKNTPSMTVLMATKTD
jgi:hypothetical protein